MRGLGQFKNLGLSFLYNKIITLMLKIMCLERL